MNKIASQELALSPPYRLEVLRVTLDMQLEAWELVALRAAISELVGPEHVLFHHHLPGRTYRMSYPLIQYRFLGRRPGLFCLGEGTEEVQEFFNRLGPTLMINDEERPVKVHSVWFRKWPFQVWRMPFRYRIRRWLALNPDTFPDYQEMVDARERASLLSKVLRAQILAMARGIGWEIDRRVKVDIERFREQGLVRYKDDIRYVSFEAEFRANVSLPNGLGLGKGVSKGFGGIRRLHSGTSPSYSGAPSKADRKE